MSCVLGVGQEVRREKVATFEYKGTHPSPQCLTSLILKAKLCTSVLITLDEQFEANS